MPTLSTSTGTTGRPRTTQPGTTGRSPTVLLATASRLLTAAHFALDESAQTDDAAERYAMAHLAALRAAAAILADRARPADSVPRRPTSAWTLLTTVAPELAEWAAYFAAGAGIRAAAEAGMRGAVTARQADDLLRDADTFVALVETTLGMLPIGIPTE